MSEMIGTVVRVVGPIIDVRFAEGELPPLFSVVSVQAGGHRLCAEVLSHPDSERVRCIALGASEGVKRGAKAASDGRMIHVPVGEQVLGRVFNVLGEPIDGKGALDDAPTLPIYRDPPAFRPAGSGRADPGDRHQGHRPALSVCPRRKDRAVRRSRRGQERADPGADPQHRDASWRPFGRRRRRRADQRGV